MRQHSLSWCEIPVRQFLESRRIGSGDRLYLRIRSRSAGAAPSSRTTLHHSVHWDELPEALALYFRGLGIVPGDRIYFGKLRKLTDASLARSADSQNLDDVRSPQVAKDLAERFDRRYRTIQRRLKRLSISLRSTSGPPGTRPDLTRQSKNSQTHHPQPVKENS